MDNGTPRLIDTLRAQDTGRAFYQGKAVDYKNDRSAGWLSKYECLLVLADGREVVVTDAYDELGFAYLAPDSGEEMTNMLVPLEEGEADPVGIPTAQELATRSFDAMRPVFESIQRGETDPADLDFARQLFSSPEALLRTIQKEGTAEKACSAILRDMFRIT